MSIDNVACIDLSRERGNQSLVSFSSSSAVSSTHLVGSHATVVGTLGSGETILGPAKWMTIEVKECVLLLDTEPGLLIQALVHHLQA